MNNYNLPFTIQNTPHMPTRPISSRYDQTPLGERFPFSVSDGKHPAEYLAVNRYLPVLMKDVTSEDFIVIPKGRLVSAMTTEDNFNGFMPPASGSYQYTFTSAINGTISGAYTDNSYFGYDNGINGINGLIVPANGGSNFTMYYGSDDVADGMVGVSGALVSDGTSFTVGANRPIGAVYHDWYQDIRGKYLNYKKWPDGGHVVTNHYIEVPFVKTSTGVITTPLGSGVTPVPTSASVTDWDNKFAINKKFTYLTVSDANQAGFRAGGFISADGIGNYTIQSTSATANRTIQTIGKIIGIDNRFPKNGNEDVLTYPGISVAGNQTAGLPVFLFEFVKACQTLTGTVPTIDEIYNYVRAGYYGVARILLSVY